MPIGKAPTVFIAAVFLLAVPFAAWGDHLSEYNYIVLQGDELIGSYRVNFARSGNEIEIEVESVLRKGFETIDCGFHAANAPGCCCSALTCAGVI